MSLMPTDGDYDVDDKRRCLYNIYFVGRKDGDYEVDDMGHRIVLMILTTKYGAYDVDD